MWIEKIVHNWNLPAWSYLPIKILLLIAFLAPVGLWIGNVYKHSTKFSTVQQVFGLDLPSYLSPHRATSTHSPDSAVTGAALPGQSLAQMPGSTAATGTVGSATTSSNAVDASVAGASTSMLKGIDVSHYQGTVNWKEVAANGIAFTFVKATGGTSFVDPQFKNNWHGSRSSEVIRGAYHFFYPSEDPVKQANHFLDTMGALQPTDLPPVLDIEILDNTSPAVLIENSLQWLDTVEKATGRIPMVYTDVAFGNQYLSDSRFQKYGLWIAEYGPAVRSVPSPWASSGWNFWQYSQSGNIPGIAGVADTDYFAGNRESLVDFVKRSIVKSVR